MPNLYWPQRNGSMRMGNFGAKVYSSLLPLLLLVGCAAPPIQAAKPTLMATELESRSEVEVRTSIYMSARERFEAEDFASLEKAPRTYRSEKSRTPSGVWKLSVFYRG